METDETRRMRQAEWSDAVAAVLAGSPLDEERLIDSGDALAAELARLEAERDALATAILPDWKARGWDSAQLVLLASAHREDSMTIDDADERPVVEALRAERDALARRVADLTSVLSALHGLVWGECPSLLDEDSDGDAELDIRIHKALGDQPSPPLAPEGRGGA